MAVDPLDGHSYLFWQGPDGSVEEAWDNVRWHGPVSRGWTSASAPSVAVDNAAHQYVFWLGTDGYLREAWYIDGWHSVIDTG